MKSLKQKLVRSLGRIHEYVPNWSKPILKPFSGIYSKVYKGVYTSIKEEKLVKTPMGPLIYVNYWDCVEREIVNGNYERKYIDLFCSKVQERDVVVDVGAYIGYFSLLASERVGDEGCVYAFEPVPRNYERLLRNINENQAKNIKPFMFGLSDRNEILSIKMPGDNPGESTLSEKSWTELFTDKETKKSMVKAKFLPFDEFYKINNVDNVNVIKIDVEGAEFKVVKGMKNTLKHSNPKLFMEIIPPLIEQIDGSCKELMCLLIDCGFSTIYSVESREMVSTKQDVGDIIKWIGIGGNFILSKGGDV